MSETTRDTLSVPVPVAAMPASGYGWRQFKQRPRHPREAALIEGVLYVSVGGFFLGLPKNHKSLSALAMTISMATGIDYAGQKVPTPRRVAYLMEDTDAATMIEDRVDAFLRGHGLDPADPDILDTLNARLLVKPWNGFTLDDPRWREVLDRDICAGWRAEVVFLDVLRNITNRNLNVSEEVGPLLNYLTGLHMKYGTTFFVLHHEGFSAPGRPMGSVTLDGWWQQCITFVGNDSPGVRLTIESKVRPTTTLDLGLTAEMRTDALDDGKAIEVPHVYRYSVKPEEEKKKRSTSTTTVDKVLTVLSTSSVGMLADDVADKVGCSRRTAKDTLDLLVEREVVVIAGSGRRSGARTGPMQPLYRRA
jgi:hypothetical protein